MHNLLINVISGSGCNPTKNGIVKGKAAGRNRCTIQRGWWRSTTVYSEMNLAHIVLIYKC